MLENFYDAISIDLDTEYCINIVSDTYKKLNHSVLIY